MKKNIIALLLAGAAGASFAAGASNQGNTATTDYKAAIARCNDMKGSAKKICTEEARSMRAHANADSAARANKTQAEINKARIAAVEADYGLARARCAEMSGDAKDNCLSTARKAHASSIADVRAGREWSSQMGASAAGATATGRDARAISRCEQLTGDAKAACLIDDRSSPTATAARAEAGRAIDRSRDAAATVAQRTENATERAADRAETATERAARRTDIAAERTMERAENATERAAQRTENAAERAVDRTEIAAERAADRTRDAAANVAEETREATATAAVKTERAAEKTGKVIADATMTTKVKAALLAEQALKSLDVHVETEKGVVRLSGFVDNKQQADRAVQIAKGVEGVTNVRSTLQVK